MKTIIISIILASISAFASAQKAFETYSNNIRKAEVFLEADGGKVAAKCAMKCIRKAEKSVGGRTAQTIALRVQAYSKKKGGSR